MVIWRQKEFLVGKWRFGGKIAYLAGKWRAALNRSFLLTFESLKSARKWRFGGKMNFWQENGVLAGKWRAWRVALNERILLVFESLKSTGKWRFGRTMHFWRENGMHARTHMFDFLLQMRENRLGLILRTHPRTHSPTYELTFFLAKTGVMLTAVAVSLITLYFSFSLASILMATQA